MATKSKWVSLRVQWNPKTGELRMPGFIEVSRDLFVSNPAQDALREFGCRVFDDDSALGMSLATAPDNVIPIRP